MKVKIKSRKGFLLENLSTDKEYKVLKDHYNDGSLLDIHDDDGDRITILVYSCGFLGGGEWDVINED